MITYSAAISACEKGHKWEKTRDLLCEMRQCRIAPETIAYSATISACEKGQKWEKALDLLCEMRQHRVGPTRSRTMPRSAHAIREGRWRRR